MFEQIQIGQQVALYVLYTGLGTAGTVIIFMLANFLSHFKELRNDVRSLQEDMTETKNDVQWLKKEIQNGGGRKA